jgi:ribokinase
VIFLGVRMQKPIAVMGSVNFDLVATAERVPLPGETLTGIDFGTFYGGKGANQAVAVARLGYPVSMIAKVGDDDFGPGLKQALRKAGVYEASKLPRDHRVWR